MTQRLYLQWSDVSTAVEACALWASGLAVLPSRVCGVPRGGMVPAVMLSHRLGVPFECEHAQISKPAPDFLAVDDIVDTGRTLRSLEGVTVCALVARSHLVLPVRTFAALRVPVGVWIVFPWERTDIASVTADQEGYDASRE